MAKKKAAKKVSRDLPKNMSDEDAALAKTIDDLQDEEIEEIVDAGKAFTPKPQIQDAVTGKKSDNDLVKVSIPVHLKINRVKYPPGTHTVPRHLVPVILEMVDRKKRADISMFTGKNFLIERLLDRTLVVKEVDDIDLKKI